MDMPIGATIKALRLRNLYSQSWLASRMGVPRTYISKIERGNARPNLDSIERFSIALGIEPWRLMRYACKMRDRMEAA